MTLDTVQSLWIDSNLTRMERLSIKSFLAQGHPYHLYTYSQEPMVVPEGAVVCDARDIVAEEDIWTHRFGPALGSYAGFSDYFRYMLLYKKGGVWADADLICLRPLPQGQEIMIGSECYSPTRTQASTQLLKFPAGEPLLAELIAACEAISPQSVEFCKIGPDLISQKVEERGYSAHRLPYKLSCPVPWNQFYRNFLPEHGAAVMAELDDPEVFCLHLWHELLRRQNVPKSSAFAPGCAYEQLAALIGADAPEPDTGAVQKFTARLYLEEAEDPFVLRDSTAKHALIERAIATDPTVGRAYLALVRETPEPAQPALAGRLDAAHAAGADDSYFHLARLELACASQDMDLARTSAVKILEGEPDALCQAGMRFLQLDKVDIAHELLLEGVKAFPNDGMVFALLARAKRRLGDREEALALLKTAARLNPFNAIIRANLADELIAAGDAQAALADALVAVELSTIPRVRLALARALFACDQTEDAEKILQALLDEDPNDRGAVMLLAQVLRGTRRRSEAIDLLRAYLEQAPKDSAATAFLDRLSSG